MSAGALQRTASVTASVVLTSTPVGAPGGSSTLVTVTVTACVSSTASAPWPSLTRAVREWLAFAS